MKAVAIKLDDSERGRLAELAKTKQRSAHFLMREAIREYLEREEARQAFIAAAEASYEHYKETGLHLTIDEFAAWVDEVSEQPEATPPKCHA
ncbi:MAG TPA: ribbon-helix-helix protein, CopG family [Kofleriaceae bacterium]|nr:ribbon-helix-helix protein, CopG family [Kofleriaceae bacterium]